MCQRKVILLSFLICGLMNRFDPRFFWCVAQTGSLQLSNPFEVVDSMIIFELAIIRRAAQFECGWERHMSGPVLKRCEDIPGPNHSSDKTMTFG